MVKKVARVFTIVIALIMMVVVACAPAAQPTAAPVAPAAPKQPQAPAAPAAPTAAAAPMAQPTSVPGATAPVATSRPPASLDKATIDKVSVSTLGQAVPDIRYKDIENVRYGGFYRVMTHQATASLDVAINYSGGSGYAVSGIYEGLFASQANDKDYGSTLQPLLAESWTVSPDLKTYTVKLKKGIHWQNIPPVNGREFVAKDVKFSYEQYMQPNSVSYGVFSQVASIDTPDNYTVVIHLKEPNSFLFEQLRQPKELVFPPELLDRRNTAIGTGPWILTRFTAGTGVGTGTLEVRNPDYWLKDEKGRQLPYLDRYEYISISEVATKMAALRTGQIDQVDGLTEDDIVNLLHSTPDLQLVKELPEMYGRASSFSIVFNTKKAPWNDPKMRCAVSKAIDKEKVALISTGSPGVPRGPIAFSLIEDRLPTDDDMGPCYKYDPEGAKTLLRQFGVSLEKPMSVVRAYGHVGDWTTVEEATIQSMLAEVGINMQLKRVDYATFTSAMYKRDFEEWAAGWGVNPTTIATVSGKFSSNGRWNFSGIESPEIDAKVAELQATIDPVKQRQIVRWLWDGFVNNTVEVMPRARIQYTVFSAHTRNIFARVNCTPGISSDTGRFPWLSDAPRTSP